MEVKMIDFLKNIRSNLMFMLLPSLWYNTCSVMLSSCVT